MQHIEHTSSLAGALTRPNIFGAQHTGFELADCLVFFFLFVHQEILVDLRSGGGARNQTKGHQSSWQKQ